jgi:MFS transporter, BCD family, chlorophyll transporter
MTARSFGALSVARLALVQAALGGVVVLLTATLNRVMVVELALPAAIPGVLVALHYGVQLALRPRMGHFGDQHGDLPRWIVLGMLLLALGANGAVALAPMTRTAPAMAYPLLALSFCVVGLGVSLAGTLLLTLLSLRVPAERHARAAAAVWLCMIAGFIVTTVVVGKLIEPFSFAALRQAAAIVGGGAVLVSALALVGIDRNAGGVTPRVADRPAIPFMEALHLVWGDATSRRFAWFIAISMLAYSTQDLILEPFAGAVFGLSPADSTRVSGLHQAGALIGMLATAILSTRVGTPGGWARWGCVASAFALLAIAASPMTASVLGLKASLLALGIANGAFAIGAIGAMMGLSAAANPAQAGIRMGVYGAAQAVAQAVGGLSGAVASDELRRVFGSDGVGFGAVFALEAALFAVAAVLASAAADAGRVRSADVVLAAAN